jgi:aryl-alcohol dehydrogenase-like predicted oxidoreductase
MIRLGRTGLDVSACTVGTAGMTAHDADPGEIAAMIASALDHGVTAFEIEAGDIATATLLGTMLRRERAAGRVHIFARVTSRVRFDLPSPHVPAGQAFPGHRIRAETDALLGLLGVERLAVQHVHAWCPEWLDEGDWYETLAALRQEGKIAGIGISLFDHDIAAAFPTVASGAIDTVQLMYNLFDQGAAATGLLELCAEHDVGVIARSPLYFGALVDTAPTFAPDDWRASYFHDAHRRETAMRARRVADMIRPDATLTATALRFAASHRAVATVAVGMRTREHLDANLAALRLGALPPERVTQLADHRWLC